MAQPVVELAGGYGACIDLPNVIDGGLIIGAVGDKRGTLQWS